MKTTKTILAAFGVFILFTPLTHAQVAFDWATVGDIGNANDTTGYGAVAYEYRIQTTEVNLFQYTAFLNAVAATDTYGLYNTNMGTDVDVAGITRSGSSGSYTYAVSGSGNRPVTYVSWFDAARFTNWVANGQPTGTQGNETTEDGAYTLGLPYIGVIYTKNGINPNTSATTTYWIPSENEWYKAAYYQPEAQGGDTDNYWLYPTASNTIAGYTIGVADSANYRYEGYYARFENNLPSYLTDGGAYGANSASFYGTYDQAGNVAEWNDAVINDWMISDTVRGIRGGSYITGDGALKSSIRFFYNDPSVEFSSVGFRVASVPEPSTALLVLLGGGAYWLMRRSRVTL